MVEELNPASIKDHETMRVYIDLYLFTYWASGLLKTSHTQGSCRFIPVHVLGQRGG